MKNSFRCTLGERQLHYKPDKAKKIINACCALHNLRRKFNVDEEEPIMNDNFVEEDEENLNVDETTNGDGTRIRNQIMNSIIN